MFNESSDLRESGPEYSELACAGHLIFLLLTNLHLEVPIVFLPHVELDARLPLYVTDSVQVDEGPLKGDLTLWPEEFQLNARVSLVPQYPELEANDLEDEALLGQEGLVEALNLLVHIMLFEGAIELVENFWEDAAKGRLEYVLIKSIVLVALICQTFNDLVGHLLSLSRVEIFG